MATFERQAGALWKGDLQTGSGVISTQSQALFETPYEFKTRFGDKEGTNPEELIAAAHAACYCMAFSSELKKNGFNPEQIGVSATCTLVTGESVPVITQMRLHIHGKVPGIDKETFITIAKKADKGCPVSNLLRPGVNIEMEIDFEAG